MIIVSKGPQNSSDSASSQLTFTGESGGMSTVTFKSGPGYPNTAFDETYHLSIDNEDGPVLYYASEGSDALVAAYPDLSLSVIEINSLQDGDIVITSKVAGKVQSTECQGSGNTKFYWELEDVKQWARDNWQA